MALHLEEDPEFARGSPTHPPCPLPAQLPHLSPCVQEEERSRKRERAQREEQNRLGRKSGAGVRLPVKWQKAKLQGNEVEPHNRRCGWSGPLFCEACACRVSPGCSDQRVWFAVHLVFPMRQPAGPPCSAHIVPAYLGPPRACLHCQSTCDSRVDHTWEVRS